MKTKRYYLKSNNDLEDNFKYEKKFINKIAKELKLKYKNVFTYSKYTDEELINDINNAIKNEHVPLLFKFAFQPIEKNILSIVKQRLPEKKIKLSPNKIDEKEIKNNEENDYDYEKEKIEEKKRKQMENRKIELEKRKEKDKITKEDLNKIINKKNNKSKSKKYILNQDNDSKIKSHNLVDEYKFKVKNDAQGKYFKYDTEKYNEEQKKIKQEKKEKSLELKNALLAQINEKHNQLFENIKLNNIYMNDEYKDYIKWIDKENDKHLKRTQKIKDYQIDLSEQKTKDKNQYNSNSDKEVETISDNQRTKRYNSAVNINNDFLLSNNINSNNTNDLNSNDTNTNNLLFSSENINTNLNNKNNEKEENPYLINDYIESDKIKERVYNRMQDQKKVANYLKKIYESHEKNMIENYNKIILGDNNYDLIKKNELENADIKRIARINDMKKFFEENNKKKSLDAQRRKNEDYNYRLYLNKSYNDYLNEKELKRKRQLEQYEQYRKELEAQIQEKYTTRKEQEKYL
jgi:hypothetical protein